MKATLNINGKGVQVDFSEPIDISMPLSVSQEKAKAWYINGPEMAPVKLNNWEGSVSKGASVNFYNVSFNPHAHGTHTECVGHITKEKQSVNKALKQFMFLSQLITVTPRAIGNDFVIDKAMIEAEVKDFSAKALIIRTAPNTDSKLQKEYSNTNWPYITEEAMIYIRNLGVDHLLIDLPSVDKEQDEGALLAHKAFWNYEGQLKEEATITELIYIPSKVEDGAYLLNLQIAPFENDASPSKPVLYKID